MIFKIIKYLIFVLFMLLVGTSVISAVVSYTNFLTFALTILLGITFLISAMLTLYAPKFFRDLDEI